MGIVILNRNFSSKLIGRYNCYYNRLSSSINQQQKRKMSTTTTTDEVLFETKGDKALITLNRPKALNSLSLNMVRLIYPQLVKWDADPNIRMIIIKSNMEKAFCAGGDVREIAESGPNSELSRNFFREEYILNHKISVLGVPYIALINGICMGGGVGVSVHGPFRVSTENTIIAMPETQIGFFCDVGGSYFLPKLPGKLGVYLGLTGRRLKGLDIQKAGLATHFVPSSHISALENDLYRIENANAAKISHLLSKYQEQWKDEYKQEFSLKPYIGRINSAFDADSVEQIVQNLEKDGSEWAKEVLEDLSKASPTSLKVTFEQLKRGKSLSLPDCLTMEYRLSQNILQHKDFYIGIRARLIEKTNNPQWDPKTLAEVTNQTVQSMFGPIDGGIKDLEL
ncbi:3-hydroxyisobutyryl-CoA hydrolase isoform X1 [Dermatophagoides farinae]|uniref:3-hydroxyisobutyryl-CoA hydrolase isoform X1 n=1 Tax=Dermatophagoides farinae TaxID=6954 RepID=UPI003F61C58D